MKTLIMVRHAQSGINSVTNKDIDRTLDHRGRIDAADMAKILKKNKVTPDVFLSSPAQRAIETAKHFLKTFTIDKALLQIITQLYEPAISNFYSVVENISDHRDTAIIFSHNPGISEFVNDMVGSPAFNMPAGGMFAVNIHTDHWNAWRFAEKHFLFYEHPGN